MSRTARRKTVVTTSRVKRAAALAGCGLEHLAVRERARAHVLGSLTRLRGLPQKLAQALGGATEVAPCSEPVPLEALLPELEAAWKRSPESVLLEVEPRGIPASLGQVHRARLRDGREVAVKIQYPGIHEAVAADLDLLSALSLPLGGLARGFDAQGYRTALREMLARELDYRREAREQSEYAELVRGSDVRVPSTVDELSSERVLVSAWEPGLDLSSARRLSYDERVACTTTLVAHALTFLLGEGRLHADLHPGNVRFRRGPDGRVVLHDFGCVLHLAPAERNALLALVAGVDGADEDPLPFFVALGFDGTLLEPLRSRLAPLARILFEPFRSQVPFDLERWNAGDRCEQVLGEHRWNFRISGPPRLVYLMRALHGLLLHCRELAAPVAWHPHIAPLLARGTRGPLSASGIATASNGARFLCIRVTRGGEVRARVSMPANAVERLHDLLEEGVAEAIHARGIVLDDVLANVRARGIVPQEVFRLEEPDRRVEVWLE